MNIDGKTITLYGIIFILCLSHAAYTDWFKGKQVSNVTALVLLASSLSVAPFLYNDPVGPLIAAAVWSLILLGIMLTGMMGGGDFKIYVALAPIFGYANILFFFVATLFVFISVIFDWKGVRDTAGKQKGSRLGEVAACPGMAVGAVATLFLMGCPLIPSLGMLVGVFAGMAFFHFYMIKHRKSELAWIEEISKPVGYPQLSLDDGTTDNLEDEYLT